MQPLEVHVIITRTLTKHSVLYLNIVNVSKYDIQILQEFFTLNKKVVYLVV